MRFRTVLAVTVPLYGAIFCGDGGGVRVIDEPSLTAFRTSEAPAIDGILNDACWEDAQSQSFLGANGTKPLLPTTIRVVWDDESLYLAFECQDNDAASTVNINDGPVAAEDCIQFAVDTNADSLGCFLVEIAPTGVRRDAYVLMSDAGATELPEWNFTGMHVSVSVYGGGAAPGTNDRFWTAEVSVPFGELKGTRKLYPSEGDYWRLMSVRRDTGDGGWISSIAPLSENDEPSPASFMWLKFGGS